MDHFIRVVYSFCGISAYPAPFEEPASGAPCHNLKAENPLSAEEQANPEFFNGVKNMTLSRKLLPRKHDEDKIVWLWGTGEAAHVISISPNGDALIHKIDAANTEVWPAYAWTCTTPDLDRIIRKTSLRALQTFFVNSILGFYDLKFKAMTGEKREFAMNLLLRIAPQKLSVFKETPASYAARFRAVREDHVVLTALAMSGDQRVMLMAKTPALCFLAMARAGRIFLPFADGSRTVYDALTLGKKVDNSVVKKAIALSEAEEHGAQTEHLKKIAAEEKTRHAPAPPLPASPIKRVQSIDNIPELEKQVVNVPPAPPKPFVPQEAVTETPKEATKKEESKKEESKKEESYKSALAESLAKQRAAMGYDDEEDGEMEDYNMEDFGEPQPPRPFERIFAATRDEESEPKQRTLQELHAQLQSFSVPMAAATTREEAMRLLDLRKSDLSAFNAEVEARSERRTALIEEEIKNLRKNSEDAIRTRAVMAGVAADDVEGLAEFIVDPLAFRAAEKAAKRAGEFEARTGISKFESRRKELEARLAGAS